MSGASEAELLGDVYLFGCCVQILLKLTTAPLILFVHIVHEIKFKNRYSLYNLYSQVYLFNRGWKNSKNISE